MDDEHSPTFPLHRYLLFGGNDYYARGGCWDLMESYPTQIEAEAAVREVLGYNSEVQWAQLLDTETGRTTNFSWRHENPVTTGRPEYYYQDRLDEA